MRNSLVKAHKEILQYFLKVFFSLLSEAKGYLRKKENEAALQNNCCLFLSCCISSSILSQTPFAPGSQPRCPPHPMPRVPPAAVALSVRQTRRGAPAKTHSWGRGKAPQGICHSVATSTASTAWFVFVSPHQCEGNERSEILPPPPRTLQPPPLPRLLPLPTLHLSPANVSRLSSRLAQVLA